MRIELASIGDELLSGRVVNSNASWICQTLKSLGLTVAQITTLPDNKKILYDRLKEALDRADLVITTGGLGPTCDDLTRSVAAELFHSDFQENKELLEDLTRRYKKANASIKDQASVPSKAKLLQNLVGTAPGLLFSEGGKMLVLLPGVPQEMRSIVANELLPYLVKNFPAQNKPVERQLHFALLTESQIDPFLREHQAEYKDLSIGIYPGYGTVSVSLLSPSETTILHVSQQLIEKFSTYFYQETSVEEALHKVLAEKKLTLATAESCTGGQIAAMLTKIPGASNYFLGSIVSYCDALKEKLLRVAPETLKTYGNVSQECVTEMLLGVFSITDADYAIAISGILGPSGGTAKTPVGTVFAAIGKRGAVPAIGIIPVYGNREVMIESASRKVLAHLLRYIVHGTVPFTP